ncbi:structural maintenance of chromosomes protein 2-like [Onthophagus taurus]|uniref:structural maintenance of chromosomes protein 2-like n=1 Tax=Onthophagus taurus TaxID=166361 RepID=UPI0039BE246F
MCANVERLKSGIIDNLSGITELLRDWQSSFCASTDDNERHFREIHLLIDKMRNHVHSIETMEVLGEVEENDVLKTILKDDIVKINEENLKKVDENIKIFEENTRIIEENIRSVEENIKEFEENMRKSLKEIEEKFSDENVINIPADLIEKRINKEKSVLNYRNKSVRDASSWEYLDKWNEILDDELTNKNFKGGVNLIAPKRIQQFGDSKRQKFSSTQCILEEESYDNQLIHKQYKNKKSSSTGDLLDDIIAQSKDEINYRQHLNGSNYLLSLRDLQSFDKLNKFDDSDDECESDDNENNIHKPKIVGVIYKEKL